MSKFMTLLILTLIGFELAGIAATAQDNVTAAPVQDFKIESKIFVNDDESSPVCTNRTLFKDGLVIDLRFDGVDTASEPVEITIYDTRNRKFVLLDMKKKVRLNLDLIQLLQVTDSLRDELEQNEASQHLLFDSPQESFDRETERISISNESLSYQCLGQRPKIDAVLPRYYEYLDKFSLIAVTDPGSMPPFARQKLNKTVRKYGVIPSEIKLEIKPSARAGGFKAKSVHSVSVDLNSADLNAIDLAKKSWVAFQPTNLAAYRGINVAGTPAATK